VRSEVAQCGPVVEELSMGISAFATRHPIVTYYGLMFAISWGLGLMVLGPDGFVGSKPILGAQLPLVYVAALAGPSVAGLLSVGLVRGRAGMQDLLSRLFRWHVSPRWYAVALLTAPLLTILTLLALSLVSPKFLPAIVASGDKVRLLVSGIAVALIVPFGEELGWTGFAIPQLRHDYSVVATGLIVGLFWGVWHFPLFAGSVPSALYLAVLLFSWLPPYRVLMVWVYDHTGSLLVAMLMHVSIVFGSLVLIPATPEIGVTFDLVFAAELWLLVAAVSVRGWLGSPSPTAAA
jgi:membrane protease YdiL (CAAX protease family)